MRETDPPGGMFIPAIPCISLDAELLAVDVEDFLEILRTVTAHFHHQSFALQPFIIIGIISTVRHLLMTGAHLSLATEAVQPEQFWESIIELALNGVLTFILVGAYFLIRHADQLAQAEQD